MKRYVIAVLTVLLIVACGGDTVDQNSTGTKGIHGSQDYSGIQFPITVHVYDTEKEMQQAIKHIKPKNYNNHQGLAVWNLRKDNLEMTDCELHVVKPIGVSDYEQMETWGHELAHCIYGTYHSDGER